MGTRADFYIGTGPSSEWLGSTAFDGYPHEAKSGHGVPPAVIDATGEFEYRLAVADYFDSKPNSVTRPEQGWPWPWDFTSGTDYTYALQDGKVDIFNFGAAWHPEEAGPDWPDMSARKNVTFGPRSGLIVVTK